MKQVEVIKKDKRKLITLNKSKRKHPQGPKISSDLYKALTILSEQFSKDFVQKEGLKGDHAKRMMHIYRESFKRYFKEKDFLRLSVDAVLDFEKIFKDSETYRVTLIP